jgi:hydrogenase maturation protein HypF
MSTVSELRPRRKRLAIQGQVQGVGFRPFVHRLAASLTVTGWIVNDARGVTIEVQGEEPALAEFARRLRSELPPLAQIARFEERPEPAKEGETGFEIRPSEGGEVTDAQVTVDTAVCADCLREMNDPADPRYRYPFINCTNCGPRYTIVRRIPYDRPNTTMAEFAMCPLCGGEYRDPANRRFHAQPIACPTCGPTVWLVDTHGKQIACDNPIEATAAMIEAGKIVAIKGLGGFHLACRADDDHAVRRLRQRKRRDAKPFAVMVAGLDAARRLGRVDDASAALLSGPLRPIVLLPVADGTPVAPAVAEGLSTLGVMLPYTPLHHLLFWQGGLAELPLVMTSGNYSEEPLVKDNEAAIAHLGRIADAVLLHNRPIERRIDDSVVQIDAGGEPNILRRARGYAPRPVALPIAKTSETFRGGPSVLAVGGELKNAVCLLKNGQAVLSEHLGDLKDGRTYRHFIDTIHHLETLFDVTPELIACDLHPQYLSTEYALRRHRGEVAARSPLPLVRVQHHHAHIAACLAENGVEGPVIGLACDGTGYGDDGAIWGCEILRAGLRNYWRLGHLRYLPLLGGDSASHETYRPALAALYDALGEKCLESSAARALTDDEHLRAGLEMLRGEVNCPPTSSLGRWFDAVAALTGVAKANRYEGEAPMRLEAAVREGVEDAYEFRLTETAGHGFLIDPRRMTKAIVADVQGGEDAGVVAARFHNTVAAFLAAGARRARDQVRLDVVALSGGCFANRYMTQRLVAELERDGFRVLRHRQTPCNDGAVALGQAVVAAARHAYEREKTTIASAESGGRGDAHVSGHTGKN